MKNNDQPSGRVKQKLQTRSEILKATRALMKKKQKISMDDIAEKAKISRATLYRYYSNIDILVTEASLHIQFKSPDQLSEEVNEMPLLHRIHHIQKHYNTLSQKNEIVFRRYISAVLKESIISKKQLRGARRIESLKKALRPFKGEYDNDTYNKLISISSVLMGIDPLITCKDVCNLNNEESNTILEWGIEMILKGISQDK
tara:strand:- start:2751 stop:3353 length:603 start_codon:yes stop_codon:yes gene_type:complete